MTDSILVLRGLEELYPEIRFIERLRDSIEKYPDLNWGDAMSRGQITSKMWILEQLKTNHRINLGVVAVCGGWVGILPRMLLDDGRFYITHLKNMDTDEAAIMASLNLNLDYDPRYSATPIDCNDVSYARYDTVINTSCEHFDNFDGWFNKIPSGKMVILQSNNFTEIEDHVDCVHSVDELVNKAGLSTLYYSGELPCYGYTRYMVIGVK
jgi:hypothetical protein